MELFGTSIKRFLSLDFSDVKIQPLLLFTMGTASNAIAFIVVRDREREREREREGREREKNRVRERG